MNDYPTEKERKKAWKMMPSGFRVNLCAKSSLGFQVVIARVKYQY